MPSAHGAALALTLPAAHQYPCAHSPEQLASFSPVSLPYRPAGQSVDAETLATQKPPRGHGRGCDAPPAQTLPAGHPPHTSVPLRRYVPAAHDAGIITTLPVGHVKPASHGLHVAWPSSSWNVPSPHAMHPELLSRPITFDQRPGSRGVHAEGESAPGSSH